jgi:hypothetical protein
VPPSGRGQRECGESFERRESIEPRRKEWILQGSGENNRSASAADFDLDRVLISGRLTASVRDASAGCEVSSFYIVSGCCSPARCCSYDCIASLYVGGCHQLEWGASVRRPAAGMNAYPNGVGVSSNSVEMG